LSGQRNHDSNRHTQIVVANGNRQRPGGKENSQLPSPQFRRSCPARRQLGSPGSNLRPSRCGSRRPTLEPGRPVEPVVSVPFFPRRAATCYNTAGMRHSTEGQISPLDRSMFCASRSWAPLAGRPYALSGPRISLPLVCGARGSGIESTAGSVDHCRTPLSIQISTRSAHPLPSPTISLTRPRLLPFTRLGPAP